MLNQTCEYALRAATHIAANPAGPVMARDIAEAMEIPLTYLQKVLRMLVRNRVLTSGRGIHGGFRLGRPADQIHLAEVIMPFDERLQLTTCPFGQRCGKSRPCPVHDRWEPVVAAYREFLEATTLADLVARDQKLAPRRRRAARLRR